MNRVSYGIIAVSLIISSSMAHAYEQPTHEDLTEAASLASKLFDSETLESLGLEFEPDPTGENVKQKFLNTNNLEKSIVDLLRDGANFEDLNIRSTYHFYDPIVDKGMPALWTSAYGSPAWALEDRGQIDHAFLLVPQKFSYRDAQEYLYTALTATDDTQRKENFGRFFQALGHVLHHVQDMGQPEHVRVDAHFNWDGFFEVLQPVDTTDPLSEAAKRLTLAVIDVLGRIARVFWRSEDPSLYEHYTQVVNAGEMLLLDGSQRTLPFGNYPVPDFPTASDFWDSSRDSRHSGNDGFGTGLAEFTNANFVSADTNFQIYGGDYLPDFRYILPLMARDVAIDEDISDLQTITEVYADAGEAIPPQIRDICEAPPPGDGAECKMAFVPTILVDKLSGEQTENPRGSSLSLFDQDIERFGGVVYVDGPGGQSRENTRLFYLNRFNFDAAHDFLIPRAVAYGAGLINHFFRGRLEISRPDQGFYFDIDSIIEPEPGKRFYTALKLKVKNVTDDITAADGGIVKQHMSDGSLEVMVYYRLPGVAAEQIRRTYVRPVDRLSADSSAEPEEFAFLLRTAVPVEATEIRLQAVYRGGLGTEPETVVAAIQEIDDNPFTLELALPPEGVFAVVDHAVVNQIDDGFRELRVDLQAVSIATDAPVTQPRSGWLTATARYYRNVCYQPDLSGEFRNSLGDRWTECPEANLPQSEVLNDAVAIPLDIGGTTAVPQTLTFDFSGQPVPLNATDLVLDLVYTFLLDDNYVFVRVTRDISEATYFSIFNSNDQVWLYDSGAGIRGYYTPQEIAADPVLSGLVDSYPGYTYQSVPADLYQGISFNLSSRRLFLNRRLPAAAYSRVAYLGEPFSPTTVYLHGWWGQLLNAGASANVVNNLYLYAVKRTRPLSSVRGIYTWTGFIHYQNPGRKFPPGAWSMMDPFPPENLMPKAMDDL